MTVAKIKTSAGWLDMVGIPPPAGSYVETIGDGSTTVFNITHNLNVADVIVTVRESAGAMSYVTPSGGIRKISDTQVRVTFGTAPSTNQYRVLVTGGEFVASVGTGPAGGDLAGSYPNPVLSDEIRQLLPQPGDIKWVPYDVTAANEDTLTPGWKVVDGRTSLLRADYPNLWPLLVPTYGAIDGSHFTLPPLAGRGVIAKGAGTGLTVRTAGQTGGSERVQLALTETPPHQHGPGTLSTNSVSAGTPAGTVGAGGGHVHDTADGTLNFACSDGVSTVTLGSGGTARFYIQKVQGMSAVGNHGHSFTGSALAGHAHSVTAGLTASAGGSGGVAQTHENMQPWIAMTPLIKT